MSEWEEKLNTLLSDPDAMAQVMNMAQNLSQQMGQSGGSAPPPPPAGGAAGPAPSAPPPLALGVAVTMWLWNALIPGIIGWTSINYWQALGLLLLIRLLFGHFGPFGWPGHPHRSRREHRHLHEAMRGMSHSEKREFIRRRMRNLCEREAAADETGKE